jgi:adenylate cyclase
MHELPLLRLRALLARARGDEPGYAECVHRYRALAERVGFEGHQMQAAAM